MGCAARPDTRRHSPTASRSLAPVIGGTAVGTWLNAYPHFGEVAAQRTAEETGNKFAALSAREGMATACGARTHCVQRSQSRERVSARARVWTCEKALSRIDDLQRVSGEPPRRRTSSFTGRETPSPRRRTPAERQAGRRIASCIGPKKSSCRISGSQPVSREQFDSLVRPEDMTHPLGGGQ
jgi:hypothetical protein